MAWTPGKERALDWLWFLCCGVAASLWCVTAAQDLGATFDEPPLVELGLQGWRAGSHSALLRLGTMPLPADVETLPLYLWERWHGTELDPVNDLDRLLPYARAATLVFWWLLLFYGWRAGRALAGPWGGRLGVALLACEPNLLAHASLATTDIALTACTLAFVYHFRMGREAGWFRRLVLPMFWLGAAVSAKASALAFAPLCMLAVEVERLAARGALCAPPGQADLRGRLRGLWAALHALRRDALPIFGGGMVLVFLYCGCDWQAEPTFVRWAQGLPEGPGRTSMVWIAEHLRIFSNAGVAIVRQMKHNVQGHGAYLLGRTAPRALWYYFPVILSIKLGVPLLLAPVVLGVVRRRALANWALLAALALLAFTVTCRVQIGIRLILPLVVLANLGVAAALVQTCQAWPPGWGRRFLAGAAGLGVAWMIVTVGAVWPNGLCYVNELWGGTEQGYLCVSEANYDWGQGLKQLARWQRAHAIANLDIWYCGRDPQLHKLPMRQVPIEWMPLQEPGDLARTLRGHYLAVSTSALYGTLSDAPFCRRATAELRARQPVARTPTFLIYDFTRESP
jgi:hypothetical protein